MSIDNQLLHIHIISDSIGATATKVAQATVAQFPEIEYEIHKHILIENEQQLIEALESAKQTHGIIFMTISNSHQAYIAEAFSAENNLVLHNLIQPFTKEIEQRTGIKPIALKGSQFELSDQYFNRIKAIEFTLNNDDGKNPEALKEADIVILGVSRTGKTPLSMYLGTLGYKVTNLPLIPEKEITPILFKIPSSKIVGLTNNADIICNHRQKRMSEFGLNSATRYASKERVDEELAYAESIYQKLQCPVINVSERSIEESSVIILDVLNLPHKPRW